VVSIAALAIAGLAVALTVAVALSLRGCRRSDSAPADRGASAALDVRPADPARRAVALGGE
jgi:hypothetical protein